MIRSARLQLLAPFIVAVILGWTLSNAAFSNAVKQLDLIFGNAIPSVRHLSEIDEHLTLLEREMRRLYLEPPSDATRSEVREHARSDVRTVHHECLLYLAFPAFPEEPPLQKQLIAALDRLDVTVEGTLATRSFDETRRAASEYLPALDAARAATTTLLQFNAQQAGDSARGILDAHQSARTWSLGFMLSVIVVIAGLWWIAQSSAAQVQREQLERIAELDAFAARVAHDLKGPLSTIPLGLGLLRREGSLGEASLANLRRMEAATQRMTQLIDGLLAYARSGAKPVDGATASLDALVASLTQTTRPLVESERATLDVRVEPGLRVHASEGVLASIVQNLVRNALVYLGESEPRTVTLRARAEGAAVVIEVEDTGPGIPSDVQRRLFRPFERGSTSVSGHGLGLATVKRFAESHGGSVVLDSEVGRGSVFRVRLPRA